MTTNDPLARGEPGGTSLGMDRPSVLMIRIGNLEVKFVAVPSSKIKLRAATALDSKLVFAGGKIRALIVLLALNVSGPV
jgi:hypothetical protein